MKKNYVTPSVELVEFSYNDQVVVASDGGGGWGDEGSLYDIKKCQLVGKSCSLNFYPSDYCKQY